MKLFKKKLIIYLVISLIYCFGFIYKINAKEINPKNLQMINSIGYSEGKAFGYNNQKILINNLSELPISKNNSIGANTLLSSINSKYQNKNALAINSIDFFHRYKFYSSKNFGLTIQNSFKPFMLYNENKYLSLMPKQQDYELRLLIANNMSDRLVNHVLQNQKKYFLRLELAYRRKFSNPFDEIRNKLWFGIKLTDKFSLLNNYELIFNVRSKANIHDNSYKNFNNFQFSKHANSILNLGLVYHCKKDLAWQLSMFKRLSGNNPFFDQKGISLGLIQNF
jgi:hypothetical protein